MLTDEELEATEMKRKHMNHIPDIIRRLQLGESERRGQAAACYASIESSVSIADYRPGMTNSWTVNLQATLNKSSEIALDVSHARSGYRLAAGRSAGGVPAAQQFFWARRGTRHV